MPAAVVVGFRKVLSAQYSLNLLKFTVCSLGYHSLGTMLFSLLLVFIIAVGAFSYLTPNVPRSTLSQIKASEQEIKDLNLEEMFTVFEDADRQVPASALEKGAPGSIFDASKAVGSSAPFGFFDPAGYTAGVEDFQFQKYQESEVRHGRVSMLAFLGIAISEIIYKTPAIYQQADVYFWVGFLGLVGIIEARAIGETYQGVQETMSTPNGIAKMKAGHIPGDLKFDPIGLKPVDIKSFDAMRVKELNNGRLAMIAIAGVIVQELVTNAPIF